MSKASKFDEGAERTVVKKESGYLRKITLMMSILMGIGNSLSMSLIGCLLSGHFKIPMWITSFAIAFGVAFVLANIFPPKTICDKVLAKFGLESNGVKDPFKVRAINSVVSTLLLSIPVTLLMSVVMVNMGGKQIDKRYDKFNTDIAALVQQQDEKKAELSELEIKHTQLQSEKNKNEAQLKELTETKDQKIAEANAGVAVMEQAITEMDGGLTEMQGGIDQINTQLQSFEAQIANAPSEQAAAAMREQMPIDSLTARKAELEAQKAELEAKKTETEKNLAEAKGAEASINNGIKSLENGIKEQTSGLASMEEGIAALNGAISGMQEGIDSQTKARDDLKKPELLKSIIGSEIVCNLLGIILNFFYMPLCLAITLNILGKHQGNLYENHIKWVK